MFFVHLLYGLIQNDWKVLQVGGHSQPFRRADFVVDLYAHKNRNISNSWMHCIEEHFSEKTWLQQDVNKPWPFSDKEFDLVVVDTSLQTYRDPIAICEEMQRVAKRGYLEVTNPYVEHIYEVELANVVGFSNHRWFLDVFEGKLRFVHKNLLINSNKEYRIENKGGNNSGYLRMNPLYSSEAIFWKDSFSCHEDIETSFFPEWFFEETIGNYKIMTSNKNIENEMWSIDSFIPVELIVNPFEASNKLVTLRQLISKVSKGVRLFDAHGKRHSDMLNFELFLKKEMKSF